MIRLAANLAGFPKTDRVYLVLAHQGEEGRHGV